MLAIKKSIQQKESQGFTLIELMLSMTFVSVLLVAIAMCSIYIGNVYQRGITLKELNQSARTIIADVQSTINTSSPFEHTPGSSGYIRSNVDDITRSYRICTGKNSYLINTPAGLAVTAASSGDGVVRYSTADGRRSGNLPRFVRVSDTSGKYCRAVSGVYPTISTSENPVELLEGTDRKLAVHRITHLSGVKPTVGGATSSKQVLYTMRFILGTTEQGTINTSGYTCRPPSADENNFTYCAINEFTITARAGNEI